MAEVDVLEVHEETVVEPAQRVEGRASDQEARAVTARVLLRFDSEGDRAGITVVRGRLFLTHKRGAWRMFGYVISKGAR